MLLNDGLAPNKRFDLGVQSVGHELEFAVGRNEGYSAVGFETGEANALVEFDVFHFDGFAFGGA